MNGILEENEYWDMFECEELVVGKHWDLKRLAVNSAAIIQADVRIAFWNTAKIVPSIRRVKMMWIEEFYNFAPDWDICPLSYRDYVNMILHKKHYGKRRKHRHGTA